MPQIQFRVDKELIKKVDEVAREEGRSLRRTVSRSDVLRSMIAEALERRAAKIGAAS